MSQLCIAQVRTNNVKAGDSVKHTKTDGGQSTNQNKKPTKLEILPYRTTWSK